MAWTGPIPDQPGSELGLRETERIRQSQPCVHPALFFDSRPGLEDLMGVALQSMPLILARPQDERRRRAGEFATAPCSFDSFNALSVTCWPSDSLHLGLKDEEFGIHARLTAAAS
jgi:hypothetical protein